MADEPIIKTFIDKKSMDMLIDGIAKTIRELKIDIRDLDRTTSHGLNNVSGGLTTLQRELLAQMILELERLTSVKNEITRTIEVDAQTNILDHLSNLSRDLSLISAVSERIKKEHTKTYSRLSKINSKFDIANEQVKDSYIMDVTRLGKYIFEIWERHYLKTIYLRMKSQHSVLFDHSKVSIEKIKTGREEKLASLISTLEDRILDYEKSVNNIAQSNLGFQCGLDAQTDSVELPVTIIESTSEKTVFNCDINSDIQKEEKVKVRLTQKVTSDMSSLINRVSWRKMSESEISEMEKNLIECEKRGFISKEYLSFLVIALKNNPPMTIKSQKR